MKFPHNLICIDIECTDSDSHTGSVIQIGAVIVNKEFTVDKTRGEFSMYIKPLDSFRNPQSMAVNKIPEEYLTNAINLNDALEMFESFCEDDHILACWGTYFDVPFLRAQYTKIGRKWPFGYRCFDLKSAAIWESAKHNKPMTSGVFKFLESIGKDFEGTPHDALSDIKNTVRILEYYKGRS
ncbi:MAG: 3'-5' exonuclease [Patescibacteria group bacterium]|nr:3'-5' exonuclease [Patescibacteria group bacterium]